MMSMATPMMAMRTLAGLILSLGFLAGVMAFDGTRKDNLALYWGQDGAGSQQRLSYYCSDDTVDVIPLAFLYIFRGDGGKPVIDFSNICGQGSGSTFSGTALVKCPSIADDIKTCQAKGKLITLSLGGATSKVGFSSDDEAESFADQIWDMFLGGDSSTRPFGDTILDGIDLDIENGSPAHYTTFVNRIVDNAKPSGKKYWITAAPQCPYPDEWVGDALNAAPFDAVYVQFYNNYCGLNSPKSYNFDTWDNWAKTKSFNKDVKIYIGAPGAKKAAGSGYVDADTLASYVSEAQSKYDSFGGVMMWDADSAHANDRYDLAVKNAMVASGEKLGFPPRGSPASSTKGSTATKTTAVPTATKTTAVPTASQTKSKGKDTSTAYSSQYTPLRWATFNAVASADEARYEFTATLPYGRFSPHQTDTPQVTSVPKRRVYSRFFRGI